MLRLQDPSGGTILKEILDPQVHGATAGQSLNILLVLLGNAFRFNLQSLAGFHENWSILPWSFFRQS